MKKRIEWIDTVKGICIISIVLFHINYISKHSVANIFWDYFSNLSTIFEVSLFYCIAGITLNNEKLKNVKNFLKDKFKKMYVKVIIIGLLAVLFHNFFIKIGFYNLSVNYSGKIMNFYTFKKIIMECVLTLFLANREVILGPMWYVYTLILDFIFLAIIEYIINNLKFIKNKRFSRFFICFILMNISIFLSSVINFTIPRLNNTLVGLFLIDCTNYIYNSKKLKFNNFHLFIISLILFFTAPFYGKILMNSNKIANPAFLIVYVGSAFYNISYFSNLLSNKFNYNIFSLIGKTSFSIMCFHLLGFKIGAIILKYFHFPVKVYELTPTATNIFFVFYYLIFGIGVSYLISILINKIFKLKL